jgi:pre-rRNA-processing protein TSR3
LVQEHGLVGLDCSWNRADATFQEDIRGENRRLPSLLAGNPTNYSCRGKLSTVEALAAALIITGYNERAEQLLNVFKWGKTFLTLNREPLIEYGRASPLEIFEREQEFFPE